MSRINNLRNEATSILKNIKTGSHSKRVYREKVVLKTIHALASIREVPINWGDMKDVHIHKIVSHWQDKRLSDKSIRLYLAEIGFFLNVIGVHIEKNNSKLGIKRRDSKIKRPYSDDKMALIDDKISQCILKMQIYFGLTLSESFRFNPTISNRGDHIILTREVATNSRDRVIEISCQQQTSTLVDIDKLLDLNSSFISQYGYHSVRERYKMEVTKCGLSSGVSYRDVFARERYKSLRLTHDDVESKSIVQEEMGVSRITLWKYLNEQK